MKFCIDCQHYDNNLGKSHCMRIMPMPLNPVTGSDSAPICTLASYERRERLRISWLARFLGATETTHCGPDAAFFEPKRWSYTTKRGPA